MDNLTNILFALMWFVILGGVLGLALAIAAKAFAVKVDERIPEIQEKLPGANCGGCGYAGCSALAEAIVKGEAKPSACVVGGAAVADEIAKIRGSGKAQSAGDVFGNGRVREEEIHLRGRARLSRGNKARRRRQALSERLHRARNLRVGMSLRRD